MGLFGFKWVCFSASKTTFHIGKIRRFTHFENGFVSQICVFFNPGFPAIPLASG